ncbi:MAG: DUF4132 domain-containing protein [Bradymonadaceae bacterium]|nr:DUF4132 domain-containing protein [Lujinxingiaceae bacterium]
MKSLSEERREKLVLHHRTYNDTHTANWQVVGACPTPRVIAVCVAEVLGWERSKFSYCEYRRTNTNEAFAAFGEAAVPAILEALAADGAKCALREILVRALADAASPAVAAVLLEFLNDSIEAVHIAAAEGLRALGLAALPHLEEGLKSRKKNVRIRSAEVLAGLPLGPAVRALIEQGLASVKDTEAIQVLTAALGPKEALPDGLKALQTLRAAITSEDREALFERMTHVNDHFTSIPNLVLLDHRVIVILVDEFLQFQRGARSTEPPCRDFFWWCMPRLNNRPEMVWLAAEELLSYPKRSKYDITRGLEKGLEAFGARLATPLAYYLSRSSYDTRQLFIEWIADHGPEAGREALLAALSDSAKGVRETAMAALTAMGESVLPALWPLLEGSADQITCVATILRDVPSAKSVPYLEAALAGERQAARQELLHAAINACRLATAGSGDEAGGDEDFAELDRGLAGRKAGKVPELAAATTLRWLDASPVSEAATRWILATLGAEGPESQNAELAAVRSRLQDEGCEALGRTLVAELGWSTRWVMYAAGVLGGDLLMNDLGAALQNLVHAVSAHHAAHGVNALVRNPVPASVRWLDHWARKAETGKLKKDARKALADLKERLGLSGDDLVDQVTPTFNFSSAGDLAFDYGGRALTLVLDAQNSVMVRDEAGNISKSLPRALKTQDAAAVATAAERFKALKKAVSGTAKDVLVRLEDAMIVDRRWPLPRWQAFFLQNPVLYALSRGLVFAIHDEKGAIASLFFVSEEGEATDANLEAVVFDAQAVISIPHPVILSDEQRQSWSALLADAEIVQPFAQLERGFVLGASKALEPTKGKTVPMSVLPRSLRRLGYKAGRPQDGGNVFDASRQLGSQIELMLSHTGYPVQTGYISANDTLEFYGIYPQWLEGATAGPIAESIYSEAALDLQAFLSLDA